MATKTKKKPRAKRPKQQWIPGTEPGGHKDVDAAADIYVQVMRQRAKMSKEEKEYHDELVQKMIEHGLDAYETPDGLLVNLLNKKKAKVKHKKDVESNGEAE